MIFAAVFVGREARADDPLPQQPAAELDASSWSHALAFTIPASRDGVAALRIGPEILANARGDLGDLRVVDASSRQWPYVLRTEAAREEVALHVELARGERGRSRYALLLPMGSLSIDAVTLRVDRPFFDRAYHLAADRVDVLTGTPRAVTLASGRLSRAAGAPELIDLAFSRTRVASLALTVEDGDEAPLPITAAQASVAVAEIRIVAPAGSYTLLVGAPEADPPRYDVARLRERVLAAEAARCEAGPLAPNARRRPLAGSKGGLEQTALWAAMGLAVVALLVIVLRLSRKEGEQAGKGEAGP